MKWTGNAWRKRESVIKELCYRRQLNRKTPIVKTSHDMEEFIIDVGTVKHRVQYIDICL